jgi:(2R)-ethylmalonyl-CoA mutase
MDVTYDGIRRTPAEIVARAIEKKADVIGLSILSGSHLPLVRQVMAELRAQGYHHIPVVVGGIIPIEDALALGNSGVTRVYTPKDYKLDAIMTDILQVIDESALRAEEQRIA